MLVKRWAAVENFLPTSSQQILAYLRHQKYNIPTDKKTKKPTSGEEALETILRTQNPEDLVIPETLDYRALVKAKGFLKDTSLGRDGRFHPTFTFTPDTGRLAAVNPNIQQQPKGGIAQDLVELIRRTIVPSPGMVLVEVDWQAVEAVLTGWFAQDKDYMWLSLQDSHSYYCSYLQTYWGKRKEALTLDMDKEELLSELHRIKKECKEDRAIAKRINLATGYGMGAFLLAATLRCSVKDAKQFLVLKEVMAPKVAAWKRDVQMRAHKEGKLINPFGYVRFFFDIFRETSPGKFKANGKEANKALAFLPQSTAAGMMRELILDLFETPGCEEWFFPIASIHDAVLFEVEEKRLKEFMFLLRPLVERKWDVLNGLSIPAEISAGANWMQMEVVHE